MSTLDLRSHLRDFRAWSSVSIEEIARCEAAVGMRAPTELIDLWLNSGSCEGWLGATFLQVWSPSEVTEHHRVIELARCLPGRFVFASDGAEELFAFDVRTAEGGVVLIPAIVSADEQVCLARSLREFVLLPDAVGRGHELRMRGSAGP